MESEISKCIEDNYEKPKDDILKVLFKNDAFVGFTPFDTIEQLNYWNDNYARVKKRGDKIVLYTIEQWQSYCDNLRNKVEYKRQVNEYLEKLNVR